MANSRAPSGVGVQSIGVSTSTKPWRSMALRRALLTWARSRKLRCMRVGAKVQVAITQPHGLVGLGTGVERERRRLGCSEDLELAVTRARPRPSASAEFIRPLGSRRTHGPGHAQHVLGPQVAARRRRRTGRSRCGRAGRRTRGARRARAGSPPNRTQLTVRPTSEDRSAPQ